MATDNISITATVNGDVRDSARDGNLKLDAQARLEAILADFFTAITYADGA